MDQLKVLSDLKVLEGMLLQHQILMRWVKENLGKMEPEERERVSRLLETATTALRGHVEETKEESA